MDSKRFMMVGNMLTVLVLDLIEKNVISNFARK